ncbi:MAG: NAD-dependent epimerase/dehydratase family protein [bacterium]|nr:NAD-dependent epimerase/dehydratase family protein [bacterium]
MKRKSYHGLPTSMTSKIALMKGPILIFGAGGFIGINLLQSLLLKRNDVFGVSKDPEKNRRLLIAGISKKNLVQCDITKPRQVEHIIRSLKPQTVFNLAAYGSYEKQNDTKKIYVTNLTAAVTILSLLKKQGFSAYLQAGSSSEYGQNSAGPLETARLYPNSHYAVSKVAMSFLAQYLGQIENLPILHLRLYSVYGPFEEPDRLIPVLLRNALQKKYPPLVSPEISRDFIFVNDVLSAFILGATSLDTKFYGKTLNVGTGVKTTIKELAYLVRKIASLKTNPEFSTFASRSWDHKDDWYARIQTIRTTLGWKPSTSLINGLRQTLDWQKNTRYA